MRILSVPYLLLALAAFQVRPGQPAPAVDPKAYPPDRFQVSQAAWSFAGSLTVRVVQVRKKDPDGEEPRFCRAWLEAWKGDTLFKRVDYNDIDPQDGPYGIFLPQPQPSNRYFIAVKEGDSDPRVLLMTPDGNFFDVPGGWFFLTPDRRYLITQTTRQGSAISVFDLLRGELLVDSQQVPPIFQWYGVGPGDGFFFTEASDDGAEQNDHRYLLSFRRGAYRVKMPPDEIKRMRNPKVKLDFDPAKSANCSSEAKPGN